MKFFDLDSPLMQILTKMADLMWLNILTMICCIPIITAGASITAMHYMALKIVRNEETYITKGFFKSFKENFGQATIIWMILLAVAAVLGGDYYIILKSGVEINRVIKIIIMAMSIFVLFTAVMVFPVQAKFVNPISRTIKNAFAISILQFPKTLLMMVLAVLPIILYIVSWRLFPIVFLFGLSLPAYGSALLYNKTFLKMEQQFMEANEAAQEETEALEDDRIFKDQSDETIAEDDSRQ